MQMSGGETGRKFKLEEANALIPSLTPLLLQMQKHLRTLDPQRQRAAESIKRARTNGHKPLVQEEDALQAIQELTRRIEAFGCVVRDHAKGLIEFPALDIGKPGYYQWSLGASEVTNTRFEEE